MSLALQGGGSHGAFTWGVLDYLLEDGRLDIEAITGTSAGAMNALALAEGYLEGGRAGARKCLAKFWQSISDAGAFSPMDSGGMQPSNGSSRLTIRSDGKAPSICGWPTVERYFFLNTNLRRT
jgi:predicted acylesterase/phospholipase RssA